MRKMAGIVLGVGLLFVAAGCGPPKQQVWLKRGAGVNMEQALKDLKHCALREDFLFDLKAEGGPAAISSETTYAGSRFDSCMTARGFKKKMMMKMK